MGWVAAARLLEAVHDEDAFLDVIEDLSAKLGARSFFAGFGMDDGLAGLAVDSGWWNPEQIALYGEAFLEHDPCVAAMLGNWRPQEVIDLERIIGATTFEHSRLYQGFIRPLGDDTFRALGVPFELAGGKGAVTFQRGRDQVSFSPDEQRVLAAHAPALAQLFAARQRVVALAEEGRSSRDLADAIDRPMLVVRADGRLVRANASADAVLRSGVPLEVHEGYVRPAVAGRRGAFVVLLQELEHGSPGLRGMRLSGDEGPQDDAVALPLKDGTILVAITRAAPPGRASMLKTLYQLSGGECDIALRLHGGESLSDIAQARGTSLHTVRQQVRTISAKMECPRQVDIVRRIGALPRISNDLG